MLSFKLSNMRNREERYICFINSVLQFLAAIPVIRKFFVTKTYQQSTATSYGICSEISRIFNMAGSQTATSAGALRQDIGSLPGNEWVKDGQQQDATDFLRALIKALDEEMGCEDFRNSVNHVPSCVIRRIDGKETHENRFTNSEDGACDICGYRMSNNTEENFRVLYLLNKNFKVKNC